ncbi:uncharacterized protein LOC116123229 [Pistacia vera]|uniref:Uncharacterized protein n=1 Tax=Pistacia integerrima TaxID=434235 RepID=A0ACC0XDR9_9ROSI|nr:uncharacterized protein LOC116123229 [Pistacia vera]KAJ0014403.1 hypothetical protein Pint_20156 [Pistacia integerrima]
MEKEERNQRACKSSSSSMEPEFFLQWGNKKRLRCVRVKDPQKLSQKSNGVIRRRITRIDRCLVTASDKETTSRLTRNSEAAILRSGSNENRKSSSPEKEDRYYTTRGSVVGDENGKVPVDTNNGEDNKLVVWPKLYISLSNKEKEEDFLAMKGCKPPQRPKKRAKIIQRSLLLVSPGAWLTDMCQERYEVREKKSSKKRPRGLKAMGSVESDSE